MNGPDEYVKYGWDFDSNWNPSALQGLPKRGVSISEGPLSIVMDAGRRRMCKRTCLQTPSHLKKSKREALDLIHDIKVAGTVRMQVKKSY